MKKIIWNEDELKSIHQHGETCAAVAKAAMIRSGLSFDDIEQINDHYESHNWGSNTDRAYRQRAINKAVAIVAASPLKYA